MIYQNIKANLMLSSIWMYVLVIGTVLAANATTLPPIFILIIITLSFVITQFYYDQNVHINRFFISLPVSKKVIVHCRYISIVLVIMLYIFIQWALKFTGVEMHYAFDWKDILTTLSLEFIIIAIVIPFFYLIPSFIIAVSTITILMFFGLFYFLDELIAVLGWEDEIIFNDLDPGLTLLVEKYIPYQPFLIFILIAIVLLYISMKISVYIFHLRSY